MAPSPNDLARVLLQVVAILAVARLLAPLARRFGQPPVVAEIIAGVLLGPSLLGVLLPDAFRWFFPPGANTGLRLLSQVGLILFMFLVGVELDPRLLRGRAHTPLLMSLGSIVPPLVTGLAAAPWLHARHGAGVDFVHFALFLASALSVTAFPVLARMLSEHHLLSSRVGAIALTCAAVDDVVTWCLVTLVVGATRAGDVHEGVRVGISAAVLVSVVLLVLRPLLTRWVARLERRAAASAGDVTLLLFPLFAVSAASELLGVHALFAAFLVGAVLPKGGPVAELLVDKLEGLTLTLLLPLFFAYSGLRTELALIDEPSDWLAAVSIMLLATVSKLFGSTIAGRLTGLPWREASAIGILLNARGLVGLIVLNVGFDLGVFSPKLFTMLVLMALGTTLLSSPLLRLVYPPRELIEERFGSNPPDVGADQSPAVSIDRGAASAQPSVVMVCVADAAAGPALASLAHAFTGCDAAGSRVFGLHLTSPTDRASTELRAQEGHEPRVLGSFLARARDLGFDVRSLEFVSASPADDIVRIAEAKRASLLLLGAHEPWPLDGVVREVFRRAHTTVGVLVGAERGLPQAGVQRVLIGCAGADQPAALASARRFSARPEIRVTLLSVRRPGEPSTGSMRRGPWELRAVDHRAPRDALIEAAHKDDYDLVVVPFADHWQLSSGRFRRSRESLFERIRSPLLIVREEHGDELAPQSTVEMST